MSDLERSHESELEGSGVVWSANRAFNTPRAALRGVRSMRVPLVPSKRGECDRGEDE